MFDHLARCVQVCWGLEILSASPHLINTENLIPIISSSIITRRQVPPELVCKVRSFIDIHPKDANDLLEQVSWLESSYQPLQPCQQQERASDRADDPSSRSSGIGSL